METNSKQTMRYMIALLVLICCGCATAVSDARDSRAIPSTSGPELRAITFSEGSPREGEDLMNSVADAQTAEHALDINLEIIRKFPQIKFQVIGTTDDKECAPETCEELSLRRARMVNDWFLNRGIPASRFKDPIGNGDQNPLTDNASEDARSANRRAVLDFVME